MAFQNELGKICYTPQPSDEAYYGSFIRGFSSSKTPPSGPPPPALSSMSPSSSEYSGVGGCYDNPCPEGTQQLWTLPLQHETHIFIFSVAMSHIVCSVGILIATQWRVGLWAHWEERSHTEPTDAVPPAPWIATSLLRGATLSTYQCVRTLFVIDLPINVRLSTAQEDLMEINYHRIIKHVSEEKLATIMKTSWILWAIAVLLMAIPFKFDATAWGAFLSFAIILLVGLKLTCLSRSVARQASKRLQTVRDVNDSSNGPHAREKKRQLLRLGLQQHAEEEREKEIAILWAQVREGAVKLQIGRRLNESRRRSISLSLDHRAIESGRGWRVASPGCCSNLQSFQLCKKTEEKKELLRRLVEEFRAESLTHYDLTDDLWFSSPKLLVFFLQASIFQTSVNLALCGFTIFVIEQNGVANFNSLGMDSILVSAILIPVNICLLAYVAFVQLPLLSLLFPLSSKCSDAVIQRAIAEIKLINGEDATGGTSLRTYEFPENPPPPPPPPFEVMAVRLQVQGEENARRSSLQTSGELKIVVDCAPQDPRDGKEVTSLKN